MELEEIVLFGGVIGFLLVIVLHFFWLRKSPRAGRFSRESLRAADQMTKGIIRYQFTVLSMVIVALFLLLGWQVSWAMGSTFLLGGILSLIIGYFSLRIAARADERLPQPKKEGKERETIAYQGGGLTGLLVASLGMLAVGVLLQLYQRNLLSWGDLSGFAFGIALVSLTVYMSSGVFTLGAIGVVAEGESPPPSTLYGLAPAGRLVKNRLGNFAGVSVGMFASYGASAVALTTTGVLFSKGGAPWEELLLMLVIAGFGASVIGYLFARRRRGSSADLIIPFILFLGFMVLAVYFLSLRLHQGMRVWEASLLGLMVGMAILGSGEYYARARPAKGVARSSSTGAATNVISGLASGMQSTAVPVMILCLGVYLVHRLLGFYGMGVAAMALSSVAGVFVALSCQEKLVLEEAASSNRYTLGFSAVAAIALFAAYFSLEGIDIIDVASPRVIAGLLLGGLIPFFIASSVISSLERISRLMRQRFNPGDEKHKGIGQEEWLSLVAKLSANASLKEMALPGIIALGIPPLVGFLMGRDALGGLLGGAILSGITLSLFMTNAGGAWHGARIFIGRRAKESGSSDDYSASRVGDLVGKTLREEISPLINSLIIVMAAESIIAAPLLGEGFL